jgi:small subunit ribosomal protein S16
VLVIRLARTGRKKYPTYRIVAADSRRAAIGKFVVILGHYNPHTKELVIKKDATAEYLKNGAQPSNAVIKLLQKEQVELPGWVELKTRNRAPKQEAPITEPAAPAAETEDAAAATAEAPAETPTETPTESIAETAQDQVEQTEAKQEPKDQAETAAAVEAKSEAAEATSDAAAEVAQAE